MESSRCAQENDILFLESSALTGEGVEDVFTKVAKQILNKIEDGLIDPNTMVSGIHAGNIKSMAAPGGTGTLGLENQGEISEKCAC